eukprot:TRINITY_DN6532_c0_g2_i1.p1 TRINITY_DN6532_c0_g2~~TRINITY_DN6532_c0_g2_i1.p1  ORF type:complete len:491 (+),score=131.96 TRINITY_DN6532_c0_g2_i1:142-1473(+)
MPSPSSSSSSSTVTTTTQGGGAGAAPTIQQDDTIMRARICSRIMEALKEIALEQVQNNRGCIERCIRRLLVLVSEESRQRLALDAVPIPRAWLERDNFFFNMDSLSSSSSSTSLQSTPSLSSISSASASSSASNNASSANNSNSNPNNSNNALAPSSTGGTGISPSGPFGKGDPMSFRAQRRNTIAGSAGVGADLESTGIEEKKMMAQFCPRLSGVCISSTGHIITWRTLRFQEVGSPRTYRDLRVKLNDGMISLDRPLFSSSSVKSNHHIFNNNNNHHHNHHNHHHQNTNNNNMHSANPLMGSGGLPRSTSNHMGMFNDFDHGNDMSLSMMPSPASSYIPSFTDPFQSYSSSPGFSLGGPVQNVVNIISSRLDGGGGGGGGVHHGPGHGGGDYLTEGIMANTSARVGQINAPLIVSRSLAQVYTFGPPSDTTTTATTTTNCT